jgi:hypothetical protein
MPPTSRAPRWSSDWAADALSRHVPPDPAGWIARNLLFLGDYDDDPG